MAGRVETMAETKTILVAGGTGQQGGSLAGALGKDGDRVRGLTRDPGKNGGLKNPRPPRGRGGLTDKAGPPPPPRVRGGGPAQTKPGAPPPATRRGPGHREDRRAGD